MKTNQEQIRDTLFQLICQLKDEPEGHIRCPGHDFSRNRKLSFDQLIFSLLSMEGKPLTNELLRQSGCSIDTITSSAFGQQRAKLLPGAFEDLFHRFVHETSSNNLFKGLRLLAVDGSDIHIPTNRNDPDSFYQSDDGRKPYNLLHMNALYDLNQNTYEDIIISKGHLSNENSALTTMVDRSTCTTKALIIADRGYEGYNNMAHIQEKGWKFLIRIKDQRSGIACGLDLPSTDEFDIEIDLKLTRKQTNEVKELLKDKNHYKRISRRNPFDYLPEKSKKNEPAVMYSLPFRIVRFKIKANTYEVIVTNLDKTSFPPQTLKELYAMRWGIETSFRDLKYTLGLLHFHAKKVEYILQEIYARLIMYNFSELIISHMIIERGDRKYDYKVNFTVAAYICREYLLGKITPPNIEALIAKYIVAVRPGRSNPRKMTTRKAISFLYRIA